MAYTLDLLNRSGVQETIIYCTDFASEVRKYLATEDSWQDMSIAVYGNEGCTSLGDAMRDLDSKGLLRGDFILVELFCSVDPNLNSPFHVLNLCSKIQIHGGDTVGNVNLAPYLESHKYETLLRNILEF